MIIDTIQNAAAYSGVHPLMNKAMEFIQDCMQDELPSGRYELEGEDLYALVMNYEARERENPRYESHEKYIDIQCITRGSEYQWCASRGEAEQTTEYDAAKDVAFHAFSAQGHRLHLTAGTFAVYFPQDVHLPGMPDDLSHECTRVVVKIKCE